jgi:hypothetical protein
MIVSEKKKTDDLVEKSKKAVLAPFKLEQCLKIAESQFNGNVPTFFFRFLSKGNEMSIRSLLGRDRESPRPRPLLLPDRSGIQSEKNP